MFVGRTKKLPSDDNVRLKFYGFFKQASAGECKIPKPGLMEFRERAKWCVVGLLLAVVVVVLTRLQKDRLVELGENEQSRRDDKVGFLRTRERERELSVCWRIGTSSTWTVWFRAGEKKTKSRTRTRAMTANR